NVYRFSSKEFHLNSGMYYYLYRFYDPNLQRWINRDPIEERGGINLFGFAANDPTDRCDPFGLEIPWPGYPGSPKDAPREYVDVMIGTCPGHLYICIVG